MARKRRRRTAAEMAPLVSAWRRGEGTQAELRARAGVCASTFSRWCRRLSPPAGRLSPPAGAAAARFVEVPSRRLVEGGASGSVGAQATIEVCLRSGTTLRAPLGVDAGVLAGLLRAVAASC